MRAICFINETKGIIAGENSSAYITRDGGSEWIQLEGLPDFDIKDIFTMAIYFGYVDQWVL